MDDQNQRPQRISIAPDHAPLADSAERRQQLIATNEFKIRAIKHEAVKEDAGDDFIVLMLDLNDPLARQIYEKRSPGCEDNRIGQPARAEDTLQLLGLPYSPIREMFSPNHRNVLDRCRSSDIRVALMSEGRTMAMVMPGDAKLADVAPFVAIQTEEDKKAGIVLPPDIMPPTH